MNKGKIIITSLILVLCLGVGIYGCFLNNKKLKMPNNDNSSINTAEENKINNNKNIKYLEIIKESSNKEVNWFYHGKLDEEYKNLLNMKSPTFITTSHITEGNLFDPYTREVGSDISGVYINSDRKLIYSHEGKEIKSKKINGTVKGYVYDWSEGDVELIVLAQNGEIYYWDNYGIWNTENEYKKNFEFKKVENIDKIDELIDAPYVLYRSCDNYDSTILFVKIKDEIKKLVIDSHAKGTLIDETINDYYKYISGGTIILEKNYNNRIDYFVNKELEICFALNGYDESSRDDKEIVDSLECSTLIDSSNKEKIKVSSIFWNESGSNYSDFYVISTDKYLYHLTLNKATFNSGEIKASRMYDKIINNVKTSEVDGLINIARDVDKIDIYFD